MSEKKKTYRVLGTGPGGKYPRLTLPPEFAYLIDASMWVEVTKEGDILLRRA